jgi:hypothetical protein
MRYLLERFVTSLSFFLIKKKQKIKPVPKLHLNFARQTENSLSRSLCSLHNEFLRSGGQNSRYFAKGNLMKIQLMY